MSFALIESAASAEAEQRRDSSALMLSNNVVMGVPKATWLVPAVMLGSQGRRVSTHPHHAEEALTRPRAPGRASLPPCAHRRPHGYLPAELKETWMADNTPPLSGGGAFPPGLAEVIFAAHDQVLRGSESNSCEAAPRTAEPRR